MKLEDVEFNNEKTKPLLERFPIIRDNVESLEKDFLRTYNNVMKTEMGEEVPKQHLSDLKTDLFNAFCVGAMEATSMESEYRKNFSLPKEIMESMEKKSNIILPDDYKEGGNGKIIT